MVELRRERPVHALLLAESFLPHAGGSRVYYYHMFRDWSPDRVTVLTKKCPGWQEFDALESNEKFHIIRRFRPLRSNKYKELPKAILPSLDAIRMSRQLSVDVVLCGDLFPSGVVAMGLKKAMGYPLVVFCHGDELTQTNRYRLQPRIRNMIYKSADVIVANSEFTVGLLRDLGVKPERICKITPGVDCENFQPVPPRPEVAQRYALHNNFVLLTVARLVARKGHDMVLRALALLRHEIPHLRYLIVGKGPDESRLRQLAAELGIEKQVVFAGFIPQSELADHYRVADVMVMPNREEAMDTEGFGMTFIEAGACGKPVIAGNCGGAVEAVEDHVTGLLVDPTSPEQIASAIRHLVRAPEVARSLGDAGLHRARTNFDWRQRSEKLRGITRALARSRTGGKTQTAGDVAVECGHLS